MSICREDGNIPIVLHIQCHNCGTKYVFYLRNVSMDCASPDAIANMQQAVKINVEQALAEMRTQHAKNASKCVPRFVTHIVSPKEVSQ